jgi:hypothetical protein
MNNLAFRVTMALACTAVCAAPLFGQDGVYAPSVPQDAALVRVANLSRESETPRVDLGRERFAPLPAGAVGPYRPVPPGIYILGGAGGLDFSPTPGQFHTIIVDHGQIQAILNDETHTDPARAQLVLYNFADAPAGVTAVPGDVIVFDDVRPGRSETTSVNAITIDLSLHVAGEERLRREFDLERGESYGMFIGSEQVIVAPASVSAE